MESTTNLEDIEAGKLNQEVKQSRLVEEAKKLGAVEAEE